MDQNRNDFDCVVGLFALHHAKNGSSCTFSAGKRAKWIADADGFPADAWHGCPQASFPPYGFVEDPPLVARDSNDGRMYKRKHKQ